MTEIEIERELAQWHDLRDQRMVASILRKALVNRLGDDAPSIEEIEASRRNLQARRDARYEIETAGIYVIRSKDKGTTYEAYCATQDRAEILLGGVLDNHAITSSSKKRLRRYIVNPYYPIYCDTPGATARFPAPRHEKFRWWERRSYDDVIAGVMDLHRAYVHNTTVSRKKGMWDGVIKVDLDKTQ